MKKNILYISFLMLFAFFGTLSLNAQIYKAVNFPIKYVQPSTDRDYTAAENDTLSRSIRIWFVCSDRNNNNTYKTPKGKKVKEVLGFLDKFYVIGEEGEYLRLAKGRTNNMTDDVIDQDDEIFINGIDYGWIHKKNVLLWRSCLIGKNKIDAKAMLINTAGNINSNSVSAKESEEVVFYQDPDLTIGSGHSSQLFEFLFIYKQEGDAVLLGKDNYIKNYYSDFKDILVGWVSTQKILQWNHRVVAERNWEESAVAERFSKDTKAAVFYEGHSAKAYKEGHPVTDLHVLWQEKEISKERDSGQRKRFPVLSQNNGLLELGIGQVYNDEGIINTEDYEDILHEISVFKSKKRNINIVFVVDGTKGMSPYSKSIGTAVRNSVKYFQSSFNTIKFGAVVYRNIGIDSLIQQEALNTNSKAIIDFFDKEVNMSYKDADVRDVGDAVYYGIHTAVSNLGLKKKETNLIVLIGGSPNSNRTDEIHINEEGLIQLMHEYGCHLFSFLVNNRSDEYEELIYQVRDLVLGVAEKKYNQLKSEKKIQEVIKKNPEYLQKPRLVPYSKRRNIYRLEKTATMGNIYHAEYGTELDPFSFQQELIRVLKEADIQTNRFLNRIESKIQGIRNDKSGIGATDMANFGAKFLDFLLFSDLTEEKISKIGDRNIPFYKLGYAPEFIDGHQYPLFKFSLFMTREELSELYIQMKRFSEATHSNENARQEMQQVWLDILRTYIGEDENSFFSKQRISDLVEIDLATINKYIYGIPIRSVFLNTVKIGDITNPERFSDDKFNSFCKRIERKLTHLSAIINGISYPYSFTSNDINYYWISEDLIP